MDLNTSILSESLAISLALEWKILLSFHLLYSRLILSELISLILSELKTFSTHLKFF